MVYSQVAHLPIVFRVGRGIYKRIPEFLAENSISFRRVAVFCGVSFSRGVAEDIASKGGYGLFSVTDNSLDDVAVLRERVSAFRFDCLVGVGGGRVLDTVKMIAYMTRINHLAVPTIISNDGLISPIAVIKDGSGREESMAGQAPMGVVVDLAIILASPIEYLRAAAGDILSNISATNDWELATRESGEPMVDIAFQTSRMAAEALVKTATPDLKDEAFVRQVIHAQVNSGIAMSISGTSRPCSGSEHLLSHALDRMELSENLHGLQVGSLGIFCLFLQNQLGPDVLRYATGLGIPAVLPSVEKLSDNELAEWHACARTMRPGRFTILEKFGGKSFALQFRKFCEFLQTEKDRV